MVGILFSLIFLASPLYADQIGSTYKRNLMLFQFVEFGSTFTDVSTHAFAVSQLGSGFSIISGRNGKALSYTGSGDLSIRLTDAAPYNTLSDLTYAISLRSNGVGSGITGREDLLEHNGSASGTLSCEIQDHFPRWRWAPSGCVADTVDPIVSATPISSGTWHLLVYSRLNNVVKNIELDGVLIASAATGNCQSVEDTTIEIGGEGEGGINFARMDLDEATLWQTYLTAGERYQLYTEWDRRKNRITW